MRKIAIPLALAGLVGVAALAQGDGDVASDNGFIVNFLQERISAPGRQIRLQGVSGALSSQARIAEVTISDATGPWLRLQGVEIDWSRAQLLLGRVNVSRLRVDEIDFLRRPVTPPPALGDRIPQIEAQPFQLPELPVSVQVRALDLPKIDLAEAALGRAATLAATGSADLARGALDADAAVRRLDAGGSLDLGLDFSNATRRLDLDLRLQEPADGVVATLLDIENRPAIDLRLQGAGPLDALDVDFAFDAGAARIAEGQVSLRGEDAGTRFTADFDGSLSPVVPAAYRPFFAGETSVDLEGLRRTEGGLRIDALTLKGAELDLSGALDTGRDFFPRSLTLSGRLGDPEGPAIVLPVGGGGARAHAATLYVNYGGGSRWSGLVAVDRLAAGAVEIEDLTLDLGGIAENLDAPDRRNVTISAEGVATGVWSDDPDVRAALGERLDLFADVALPPGAPVRIRQAQLSGNGLSLFAAGDLDGATFAGRIAARVADVAPASGLVGRDLGGAVDLDAAGSIDPLSGAFDLALRGVAQDLRLGAPRLDALLVGETTLGGRLARDADGVQADGFSLRNPQVTLAANGRLTPEAADLTLGADLADLAALDPRLTGAARLEAAVRGDAQPFDLDLTLAATDATIEGRPLADARLAFEGQADATPLLRGALRGGATFGDQPVRISADVDVAGTTRALNGLVAEIGPNRLTGDLSQIGDAPVRGALVLTAPDVAPIAALALQQAQGALDATLDFLPAETGQGVVVSARARDIVAGGAAVGALDLDALVVDAFGRPLVNGTTRGTNLRVGGVDLATLQADARQTDAQRMEVEASARLAIGTEAQVSGALSRLPDGFSATLDALGLRQGELSARLAAPTTVTVAGGAVRLTPLALDVGAGRVTAEGEIADRYDLAVDLRALPLAVANAIQPALGLQGVVAGSARIVGPRAAPDVTFDLSADGVASSVTRGAGLPAARLTATGRTNQGRLQLDAAIAAEGIETRVAGSLPLGPGRMQLDATLARFPLAALNRFARGQDLGGSVSGTARIEGTYAAPSAIFDLAGAGLSAAALRDNGVSPLGVTARGDFTRNVLTLAALEVTNDQGLAVRGSGRAPLRGPGLDLRASGAAPLTVANAFLATRTAQATGTLRFDVAARGALAQPQLSGSATLEDGGIVDPQTNLRLQNVSARATFDGRQVRLESLRAPVSAGGEITASGTIGLARGYPADLAARFDRVRYTDGTFVSTQLDGELALRGPIVGGGGVLSGRIALGATEISVAEGLGLNAQKALDQIAHKDPSAMVLETLRRAGVGEPSTPQPTGRSGIEADIRIDAPNQIFVRGRGLDVELGGGLRITGPFNAIRPVGQFTLRRGRLDILGQRIDFDEGALQLTGNLDPQINFVARTRSQDVTAIVTVTGRVSSPQFAFSSQPPLPEDEVLARVLFNRSVSNLSPFQIAQLAAAAAELAGGGSGGPGILEQLRSAIGFDDLDIVTEEDGETAVRAGRYIDDNIYVDVQTDTSGDASARVNLDLTDNFTVRGSVASDGNSTVGVFFERDY